MSNTINMGGIGFILLSCTFIISYFLGNISPSILIGKMKGIDIRKVGSGNAGTTNVLRILGKKAAAATLIIDILKGVVAVFLGRFVSGFFLAPDMAMSFTMACGFAAFMGHIWPLIFGFKGGKGVATALGIILAVDPIIGAIVAAVALIVIALTKRISAGSVIGAISLPIITYIISPAYGFWATVMAIVVIVKHRENVARLVKGVEPKFSFKK